MKPAAGFLATVLLAVTLPLAGLMGVVAIPDLIDRVSPVYTMFAEPVVERTGLHIVFTQPLEKHSECLPAALPYAVFRYRDGHGVDRSAAFALRGPDRAAIMEMASVLTVLDVGERRVLGPFVILITDEVAHFATSFEMHLVCARPILGRSHTTLGPFKVPADSRRDGRDVVEAFGKITQGLAHDVTDR